MPTMIVFAMARPAKSPNIRGGATSSTRNPRTRPRSIQPHDLQRGWWVVAPLAAKVHGSTGLRPSCPVSIQMHMTLPIVLYIYSADCPQLLELL